MIRLLTAVLLFASFHVVADDLKTFSDGQVINADDFNHNFQTLEQDIADIPAGPQGERGPQGEQGIQGLQGLPGNDDADGADGAPGANGADGVGFPGVVATLRSGSLPDLIGAESASSVFDAVSNIASNSECGDFFPHDCELYVDGVTDHRRCITQIEYGGTQWSVEPNSEHIKIATDMFTGNWVAIVIQCIN